MTIRLGLIGSNIAASQAPDLHRIAGELIGLDVRYDRFVPAEMGLVFADVFRKCRADGIEGLNITHPFKEDVLQFVTVNDPEIARIGAVNTVLFRDGGAFGYNTDYSGFVAGWRHHFPDRDPGRVVVYGAGGVGRAVAFGLHKLGAEAITLVDPDHTKAQVLADEISAIGTPCIVGGDAALVGANGVVNCTALGMAPNTDCVTPTGQFPANVWAFDAVYTPINTPFKAEALAAGAQFMSGFELFFFQGTDCFQLFTGRPVDDPQALRKRLGQ